VHIKWPCDAWGSRDCIVNMPGSVIIDKIFCLFTSKRFPTPSQNPDLLLQLCSLTRLDRSISIAIEPRPNSSDHQTSSTYARFIRFPSTHLLGAQEQRPLSAYKKSIDRNKHRDMSSDNALSKATRIRRKSYPGRSISLKTSNLEKLLAMRLRTDSQLDRVQPRLKARNLE
jgi:hypothetical protein